ncbi:MAG: hypothetical protein C4310_07975 [Chloroflexota bacterium]
MQMKAISPTGTVRYARRGETPPRPYGVRRFYPIIGIATTLLALVALAACGGPVVPPVSPQPTETLPPPPTATVGTPTVVATPTPTAPPTTPPLTSIPPTLPPGAATPPVPLPEGFPILPEAQFVAYQPDYDPCLSGERDCAPGRTVFELWLYDVPLPTSQMGPVPPHILVAQRYVDLLKSAGYAVQSQTSPHTMLLTVTGSGEAPVAYAEIVVGPPVSEHKPPPDMLWVGLRLSVIRRQ